jgi:hypothetical protein
MYLLSVISTNGRDPHALAQLSGIIIAKLTTPGTREQAQEAPLWSEKRSHSYGLSEEQDYGHEDQPEP